MKRFAARRGSALLIVLGMIAFMVISAVAFSAYMRSSRLPSSYLRRSSASRLLVKAALAEAIEEIDVAIGNNPHPGVGSNQYKLPRVTTDGEEGALANRNLWAERVYIGSTNLSSTVLSENFASPDNTISVLNVEALAYIPPPLINEVRYYSRRSNAATWHDMSFDAGRYAFCAVDVSDYFDVNVVTAGSGFDGGSERDIPAGRNSSDTGRITLAHSFENSSHTGYGTVKPADWDKFMDEYVTAGGASASDKVPLISVADLNLAIHEKKPGGMESPFGKYAEQGASFVQSETGNDAELMRGETFVTDSLFSATTNSPDRVFDISNAKYQPFSGFPSDRDDANEVGVDDMLSIDNEFVRKYVSEKKVFGDPEFIQLYDYLDIDSIPTSLALPTVERTPIITGVMLDPEDFVVTVDTREEVKEVNDKNRYAITLHDLKMTGKLNVLAGLVYPFKYKKHSAAQFKVQAAATIALVPNENSRFALRRSNAKVPIVPNWSTTEQPPTVQYMNGSKGAVVTMVSEPKSVAIKDSVLSESDAVIAEIEVSLGKIDVVLNGDLNDDQAFNSGSKATVGVSQPQKKVDGEVWDSVGSPTVIFGMPPVNADLSGSKDNPGEDDEFVPVVQVWVRVLDSKNKVVDLVPAWAADDDKSSEDVLSSEVKAGSDVRPLLRFAEKTPTKVFKYTKDGMGTSDQNPLEVWPKAYITDDPRFNYAPENFIALSEVPSSVSDKWFEMQRSGDSDRDGDIFMAVSDTGYLQSIFEFANLLNISGFQAGKWGVLADNAYNGNIRDKFTDCPANDAMWRTYSQYECGGKYMDIADIFSDVESGSKGFRINPYTQSQSVMMAALANSPIDWWAASTNDAVSTAKERQLDKLDEANKYTFSELNGAQVTLKHDKLEKLADYMINEFKASPGERWQDVFDGMNWEVGSGADDLKKLCGQDLDVELHSVDRKFLHGFWRECFAARQQLFLVFVRAEPTMMGSGASGKAAPQLGARAVALVWRDPSRTEEDVGDNNQPRPHRSRILFYRQFD